MPVSSKRPSRPSAERSLKRPAKKASAGGSKPLTKANARSSKPLSKTFTNTTKPFLRFYYSKELRTKTGLVLKSVEEAEDAKEYRGALADTVVELADAGMEYYFMRPLNLANVGFLVEQSARFGMGATKRVFASVIRNVIGGMDNAQLLTVCSYIRELSK